MSYLRKAGMVKEWKRTALKQPAVLVGNEERQLKDLGSISEGYSALGL